ncbi:type I-G CRISPR-associated helicase/endonuclease Cas3g [Mycobacterium innocens]|nr:MULTISPECIES: CRISPR-associated endonuclease Cas3'' [Mycobacterium]
MFIFSAGQHPLPDRWQVVEMTATPSDSDGDVFGLKGDLVEDPGLAPRLNASKQASLQLVGSKTQDSNDALLQHVPRLATGIPGQVLGIMVNRVATAIAIADALAQIEQPDRVILLTGRMRPLDRDDIWEGVQSKVGAGRTRSNGPRLYVVATQTIEAGADLDFDALITEVAPVDSLRQRFGRVDRLGRLSSAGTPARIVIVAGHKQTAEKFDDPVYGKALSATWRELKRRYSDALFDVGPLSTSLPTGPEFLSPALDSPLLLDSHLDMLVQTNPAPAADLDITRWLHGPQDAPADVNIVWRADIDDRLLEFVGAAGDNGDGRDLIVELLLACPPKASEAIALPIWSAKTWLSSADTGPDLADVDQQEPRTTLGAARDRLVVRWAGADTDLVTVQDIRPGDTLVVPAARGGLRRSNWDPGCTMAVPDLGDRAQATAGVVPVLRLHADVISPHVDRPEMLPTPLLPSDPDSDIDDNAATGIATWLEAVRSADPTPWLASICQSLSPIAGQQVVVAAGQAGGGPTKMYALRGKRPARDLSWRESGLEFDGTDLTNSFIGHAVPLEAHCNGVGELASRFAAACGVPDHLRQDLALAGRLHDLGKADPRFQTWLCDGDEIAVIRVGTLLAKSADSHRDKRQRDLARRRAGYPVGMGHSLLSVALALSSPEVLDAAHDRELVLHLIASHHGHCRALPPPQPDPVPVDVEVTWDGHRLRSSSDHGLSQLDSGVTERFWRLNKRYGPHGLAWLETLLRLADHRRSALEQLRQEGGGR